MAWGQIIYYGHGHTWSLSGCKGPGQCISVLITLCSVFFSGARFTSVSEGRKVSSMAQAAEQHCEHTDDIAKYEHRGVTVYALRPHEESQHHFKNAQLIAAACLPCSINACVNFEGNPDFRPDVEGLWTKVNVQHCFDLEYLQWMRRQSGEEVGAWYNRCRDNEEGQVQFVDGQIAPRLCGSEKWQPSREGWARDEQLTELCKSQMVATRNQMLYRQGVHEVVKQGFNSATVAIENLSPHIPQLNRFQVVAKFSKTTKCWAQFSIARSLESAFRCWLDATERWTISPKPCFTAIWCVERVAVALIFNPNTNAVMIQDSHPYDEDSGASVHYAMAWNVHRFVDHAFKTVFRNQNRNSEGKVELKGNRFQQTIELVMSDTIAQLYQSNEPILPLVDIFKMFGDESDTV